MRAELLWLLAGCAGRTPTTTGAVEVVTAEPDAERAWAVLEEAAGSLEIPPRRRALSLLVSLSEADARATWIARGFWDPSPHVQRTTAAALHALMPETTADLQGFVQREDLDAYTRCGAATGLARAGDTTTLAAVEAAMEAEFELWQQAPCALAAAQMAATAGQESAARARLSEVIASGELPLDLGFVDDLGRSGLEGLSDELLEAMPSLEVELQLAMATAVLRLGDDKGGEWFRRALSDDDIEQQLEAIDFLLTLPPETSARLLQRAGGSVKDTAQLALIELGEESPEVAIQSLLALDREVRAQATRAIGGWLARGEAEKNRRLAKLCRIALVEALQDPEDMVQLQALRALGAVGRPGDAAAIAPLLESDALLIRIEAAGALIRLQEASTSG